MQGFCVKQGKTGELPKGPEPPFFKESQLISLLPGVPVDKTPTNTTFGEVLEQVNPFYKVVSQADSGYSSYLYRLHELGYIYISELMFVQGEVASVTFVAGNPRNSGDMVGQLKVNAILVIPG